MANSQHQIVMGSKGSFAVVGSPAVRTCAMRSENAQKAATLAAAGLIQQIKNLPSDRRRKCVMALFMGCAYIFGLTVCSIPSIRHFVANWGTAKVWYPHRSFAMPATIGATLTFATDLAFSRPKPLLTKIHHLLYIGASVYYWTLLSDGDRGAPVGMLTLNQGIFLNLNFIMYFARAAEILTDSPATWWRLKRFRDVYNATVLPLVWGEGVAQSGSHGGRVDSNDVNTCSVHGLLSATSRTLSPTLLTR